MKEKLVENVLKSKKFTRLSEDYVNSIAEKFKDTKEKEASKLVKDFLHKTYAVYQIRNQKKKEKILDKIIQEKDTEKLKELHIEMLHCHSSTRERKEDYEEIYSKISKLIPNPKKIIDFGCGLNLFSLLFSGWKNFEYQGFDAVKKDIELLNKYLKITEKKLGFTGECFEINAFDKNYLETLPKKKYDLCLLLKMADILDYGKKSHKRTEEFLKNINSQFVIVSFSTETISRKKMNRPRRKWFEIMVERLNYKFESFELENEIFYVVNKTSP